MASTFDNDLRLEEMATGENAGSWGTKTNTNLELIADAFGYGTFTIADADTTLTMPDGSDTDNALRSLYLKISSSADLTTTRTLTLAPNSVSKLWYIENNTSGGQTITISQGSGANVSILNGQAKLVATDGGLATAAVIDVTQDLAIPDLFIDDDLSLQSDGAVINFGADADVSLTHVADTGLRINDAMALEFRDGDLSINSSADGQLDIDADTTVQITAPTVDIDASTEVNISGNLVVDTNTLYVDSTNDRVGVSHTAPEYDFDVQGTIVTRRNQNVSHAFEDDGTGLSITSNKEQANITPYITFNISASGGAINEAMRIDANRRLLVGTTSGVVYYNDTDTYNLSAAIKTDNASEVAELGIINGNNNFGSTVDFLRTNTDGNDVRIANFGGYADSNTAGSEAGHLRFNVKGSADNNIVEAARITSDGTLVVGGTTDGAASSISLQSDGDIRGVLASGAGGDSLISAISGVSNGYQIAVDTSNNQTYKWHNGGTQSMTLDSSGNLGIGSGASTPDTKLDVRGITQIRTSKTYGSTTADLRVRPIFSGTNFTAGAHAIIQFGDETVTNGSVGKIGAVQLNASASTEADMVFYTNDGGGNGATREHLRIEDNGKLLITGTYNGNARDDAYVIFGIKNSNGDSKKAQIHADKNADISSRLMFSTTASHNFSEVMRIDQTQNLLVGTTTSAGLTNGSSNEGIVLSKSQAQLGVGTSGDVSMYLNRQTSEGAIVEFRYNGIVSGQIGVKGNRINVGKTTATMRFDPDNSMIIPWNLTTNNTNDNNTDLGQSGSYRWRNLYLGGGVYFGTETSDKLDAYEVGTWTPRISNASNSSGVDSSTDCGYVIIGDVTYLFGQAEFTNITTTVGSGTNIYLHTPSTPSSWGAQNSVDIYIPMWNLGSAGYNYYNDGYPGISVNTSASIHPFFKHGYNGYAQLNGGSLTDSSVNLNFNGLFYRHS